MEIDKEDILNAMLESGGDVDEPSLESTNPAELMAAILIDRLER